MKIDGFKEGDLKSILIHFIECNRGYHYNSIFDKIIKPHLDSVEVLESVLRSSIISDKSNFIIGVTGAEIFPELLEKLLLVDSDNIKSYLKHEFKKGS